MSIQNQVVKLHNVKLGMLKSAFKKSLSVSGENLNFKIDNNTISNVAIHESESLTKQWSLNLTEVCEKVEGSFTELKTAIYEGSEFVNKILGMFGQLANLEIHHNNGSVVKIEVIKLDEKGRSSLKISLVTAPTSTSYIKVDTDFVAQIFNPGDKVASLVLNGEDLKQLNALAKLSTNPETQKPYITIESRDGQLIAHDGTFDIALHDRETSLEAIEIDKQLFSLIEYETYDATVYSAGDTKILVLESKDTNSKIAVILLDDADTSSDFADFGSDTNWDHF